MNTRAWLGALALGWAACNGSDGTTPDGGPTDSDSDPTDQGGTDTPTRTGESGEPTLGDLPQIHVNEVMAQNATGLQDELGAFPDWIELYNPTSQEVDLEGWWLTDDVTSPKKWQFPSGNFIPAGGWLVIYADGDVKEGPQHASFKISGLDNEDIALFGPDENRNPLVDAVEDLGIQVPDVSLARMPDGGPTWEQDASPTPRAANQ